MTSVPPALLQSMQLREEDIACLAALHPILAPHFADIATQFYAAAAGDPGAPAAQEAPAELLRVMLTDWMSSGLRGPFDGAFYAERSLIGQRHVQNGLAQDRVFRAMNVVRLAYQEHIIASSAPAVLTSRLRAVNTLLDLELAIMVHHYQLDAAERVRAREQRVQAARIASMQTMTAGLAHEIRNPLNAAKLQLQLLDRRLRRGGSDPKLLEPCELAQHEITRMTDLVTDFLAFARPLALHTSAHDLGEIVAAVCALLRPSATLRAIEIAVVVAAPPMVVRIDASKVRQIVEQLVRNAIDAAPDGGHVTVTLSTTAEATVIAVEDNGPGIPAELQGQIYEPFFTTKVVGTGLGLSIVHSLVTLHEGSIELQCDADGARFAVTLPHRA